MSGLDDQWRDWSDAREIERSNYLIGLIVVALVSGGLAIVACLMIC